MSINLLEMFLQYIHKSKCHIVYFEYTQLFICNYTSIKLEKKVNISCLEGNENELK